MATSSTSHRLIRLPNVGVGAPLQVRMELMSKLGTLAASNVFVTASDPVGNLITPAPIIQIEFALSAGNDTTLVTNFAAWAAMLGLALLDTEVYTSTSGH